MANTASLFNRVALITGAASGLGAAIAKRFAEEGAAVELFDKDDCQPLATEIIHSGGKAVVHRVDVCNNAAIEAAMADIAARQGRLDILVNNAGVMQTQTAWHEIGEEAFMRMLDINLMGYYRVAKACRELLLKSDQGRILNVASRTFFMGNPGQMAYVASKGGVSGMTRVMAKEMGEHGVTVNAIAPGIVSTAATQKIVPEQGFKMVVENQAIKQPVTPEHFAGLALFIAGPDAAMITGQTILCDGGGYLH